MEERRGVRRVPPWGRNEFVSVSRWLSLHWRSSAHDLRRDLDDRRHDGVLHDRRSGAGGVTTVPNVAGLRPAPAAGDRRTRRIAGRSTTCGSTTARPRRPARGVSATATGGAVARGGTASQRPKRSPAGARRSRRARRPAVPNTPRAGWLDGAERRWPGRVFVVGEADLVDRRLDTVAAPFAVPLVPLACAPAPFLGDAVSVAVVPFRCRWCRSCDASPLRTISVTGPVSCEL